MKVRSHKDYSKYFFETFILVVALTFQPSKAIGYLIPFVAVGWFLVRSGSGVVFKKLIILSLCCLGILSFYSLIGLIRGMSFNVSNGVLSVIHYVPLLSFYILPKIGLNSSFLTYEKYAKILIFFILIQGSYGLLQKILAPILIGENSGDVVEGTINPLSFLKGNSGFGNQYFAINMIFLLIFCFPYVLANKKVWLHCLVGLFALLLASVGHAFYSLLLAIAVVFLYFNGSALVAKPKLIFGFIFSIGITITTLIYVDPAIFYQAQRQAEMFFQGSTPKSKAAVTVFRDLPQDVPALFLVGTGPGQYSSRAGLIASDTYGQLSKEFKKIPFLELAPTESFQKYVDPYWEEVKINIDAYGNSTMYRPFFSILSIYTEFGIFIFIALLVMLFKVLYLYKKIYRRDKNKIAVVAAVSLLFLFFLGFFENYYETAQGIYCGVCLILLSNSLIFTKQAH